MHVFVPIRGVSMPLWAGQRRGRSPEEEERKGKR
jgi:hypothetical protein